MVPSACMVRSNTVVLSIIVAHSFIMVLSGSLAHSLVMVLSFTMVHSPSMVLSYLLARSIPMVLSVYLAHLRILAPVNPLAAVPAIRRRVAELPVDFDNPEKGGVAVRANVVAVEGSFALDGRWVVPLEFR